MEAVKAMLNGDANAAPLLIGAVITLILGALIHLAMGKGKSSAPVALKATEFIPFKLSEKTYISPDTLRVKFDLPTPNTRLGLPIGHHISLRFTDKNGKGVQRSYTPVTGDEVLGSVTFVIKVYRPNIHPKFPDGGKLSQHIDSLEVGDSILMKGPKGHLRYLGQGKFTLKEMRKPLQTRQAKKFGMIAGGTGITPMLQVIKAILRDNKDETTMSLLYANKSEDDILCRGELEALVKAHPGRLTIHYTLDTPPDGWKHFTGFITKEMLEACISHPEKDDTTQILMCGPPPMLKFACLPNLEAMGFTERTFFSF